MASRASPGRPRHSASSARVMASGPVHIEPSGVLLRALGLLDGVGDVVEAAAQDVEQRRARPAPPRP